MLSQPLQCLFILLMITLCKFSVGFKCNANKNQNRQFDTFLFAQQWAATYCESWQKSGKECKTLPQNGIWTIHGIWPSRFNTNVDNQPSCCDSTIEINVNELKPIKEELKRYWPSVQKEKTDEDFWSYEWIKHGTCGVTVDQLDSSTKFFNQALHWLAQYNMTMILAKSNIVPDNEKSYALQDIHEAVKSVLKKNPSIQCYIDFETGEQYLNEIRICFDQSLDLIDCDGIDKRKIGNNIGTNCRNKPVNYRNNYVDQTIGWFTYVAYIGLFVFFLVAVLLMRYTNSGRRFSQNSKLIRIFNK